MTVAELIERLEGFDPDAHVLIYDHHRTWVQDVNMEEGSIPTQEGKPEEREKLLYIRPRKN